MKSLKENLVRDEIELEICTAQKMMNYDTVEYPIEFFLDLISQEQINKELQWNEAKQSLFIESLLLGFPMLHTLIVKDNLEIIDGRQRLYTTINFIRGS